MGNIFKMKLTCEKSTKFGLELDVALTDLEKTYDNVPTNKLWEKLEDMELDEILLNCAMKLCESNTVRVMIGNNWAEEFEVSKQLPQVCGLSLTLFSLYIRAALQTWRRKLHVMGLKLKDRKVMSLYFVDDQILQAKEKDVLSVVIRKLTDEYKKAGLKMNIKKCEYLAVGI
ncbi:uncharacterized protein LOC126335759 [Schistocerca gregaria]|uniref:uncharacterized protein LOC126335759 n=1 Tax=Schistocerca gregaria TaxID=7010 RepID=UPI00211F3A7F|nr:uncharacterized protein LOC126335759 [Schistocerca gregaria]